MTTAGAQICAESLAAHGKSFAFASRWLDADQREGAAALYAWCRKADDAVDLPGACPERALGELRRELDGVYRGAAQADPATRAFQAAVLEHGIPNDYPAELLNGLEMDVSGTRYEQLDELLGYCHRVAGTVGLMMGHVLGVSDPRALVNAAHLGIAMQLTNISRDVLEDWQRGRLYVPRELLIACGARELPEPNGGPIPANLRRALARATERLLDEAERWYASGERGLSALSFRSALAIRCASRIYRRIGVRIRKRRCDPFAGRAVVPFGEKLLLAATGLVRELLGLPARLFRRHRSVPIHEVLRLSDVLRSV